MEVNVRDICLLLILMSRIFVSLVNDNDKDIYTPLIGHVRDV
jgi:hypothetical protein